MTPTIISFDLCGAYLMYEDHRHKEKKMRSVFLGLAPDPPRP